MLTSKEACFTQTEIHVSLKGAFQPHLKGEGRVRYPVRAQKLNTSGFVKQLLNYFLRHIIIVSHVFAYG